MHVQNLMNSLWDIRIFLGLVPKESPCTTYTTQEYYKYFAYSIEIKKKTKSTKGCSAAAADDDYYWNFIQNLLYIAVGKIMSHF